ncbi:MAG: hypothetical protein P1V97_38055, partial [Planctomycetota bacterium]|nr:hypothetical protein [Planctomycetota bacterium]
YHKECVTSCVILGCTGNLVGKASAELAGVMSVTEKAKTAQVGLGEKPEAKAKTILSADKGTVFRLSIFLLNTLFLAFGRDWVFDRELTMLLFLFLIFVSFYLFPASAEKRATEQELAERKKAEPSRDEEAKLDPGESEKPSRDNFYAKPNIAPPSSDPFRPNS